MRQQIDIATFLSPVVLLGLLLGGCAGDYQASETSSEPEPPKLQEDGEPDDDRGEWMLSPVDGNTYSTPKQNGVELRVQLVAPNGETRSGESIGFGIQRDDADADLASSRAPTDGEGIASVQFRAGSTLETYTVVANHPETSEVELHVEVTPLPKGNLAVTVNDAGTDPVTLESVDIQLFSADELSCDEFNGLSDLEGATFERQIPGPGDRAMFEMLEPKSNWTAVAHAYGASQKALAAGCKGSVTVEPGATTDVEIPLDLLRLNPEGTYEATSYWDLTKTVTVEVPGGDTFQQIIDFVADPAGEVFGKLADKIEEETNSLIAAVVENSSVARRLKDEIDRRIENNGVLNGLRATASGMKEAIKNLEIRSELDVGQLAEDGTVTGVHTWHTAHVYYRAECGENAPDDCGRREIELQSDQPDGLRAEFSGDVEDFDRFNVGKHTIRLDVGHILVKTLEKLVIPEVTDGAASTLEGAVHHWFDCEGMAQDLHDDGTLCVSGVCVPKDTVESACKASISWAFDADEVVQNFLDHKATIEMAGPGTLSVPNDQGEVETIDEGIFEATIQQVGQSGTSSAEAEWSAERITGSEETDDGDNDDNNGNNY